MTCTEIGTMIRNFDDSHKFSFSKNNNWTDIHSGISIKFEVSTQQRNQNWGGGGVQQQKRQRTSCDFPGGMIFFVLFCSLFEDILLTKSGKNNKKEHKRSKNTKIMIFFVLFEDTFLTKFDTKTSILNVF